MLDKEFKEPNLGSGIYMIFCKANGKCYIGRSRNIRKRWIVHRSTLKRNIHPNCHLQNMYNLYGIDSFLYIVLENTDSRVDSEGYWAGLIDRNLIVNVKAIGPEFEHSEERRKQISELHKGNKYNLGKPSPLKGTKRRPRTEEEKKKMSEANKGKKQSEAHIKARIKPSKFVEKADEIVAKFNAGARVTDLEKEYKIHRGYIYKLAKRNLS